MFAKDFCSLWGAAESERERERERTMNVCLLSHTLVHLSGSVSVCLNCFIQGGFQTAGTLCMFVFPKCRIDDSLSTNTNRQELRPT